MIRGLYNWTLSLSAHPRALWALAFVSFIESSVFPIPPDILMIPMILAAPSRAWLIALVATVSSVLGGLAGYFIGDYFNLPVSFFALGGALLFLLIANHYKATKPLMTIKAAPWQVVWFSIGLYVVVYGLKNDGLTTYLAEIIIQLQQMGHTAAVIGTGFLSAILSSIMNNMPTIMIMDIAIDEAGHEALAYANILGSNLGPKMTPIGSLATLLWLHVLAQKGVKIGWGEYMKVGLVITPPVLLVALLGLI